MGSLLLGLVLTAAVGQVPAPPSSAESAVHRPAVPIVSGVAESLQPSAPFQKLFRAAAEDARKQEQRRAAHEQHRLAPERSAPKVVCGMVVIPADPQVDAKMIRRPTESATTTMHIKKIPPAACAE
jgi:hypothetical protein